MTVRDLFLNQIDNAMATGLPLRVGCLDGKYFVDIDFKANKVWQSDIYTIQNYCSSNVEQGFESYRLPHYSCTNMNTYDVFDQLNNINSFNYAFECMTTQFARPRVHNIFIDEATVLDVPNTISIYKGKFVGSLPNNVFPIGTACVEMIEAQLFRSNESMKEGTDSFKLVTGEFGTIWCISDTRDFGVRHGIGQVATDCLTQWLKYFRPVSGSQYCSTMRSEIGCGCIMYFNGLHWSIITRYNNVDYMIYLHDTDRLREIHEIYNFFNLDTSDLLTCNPNGEVDIFDLQHFTE